MQATQIGVVIISPTARGGYPRRQTQSYVSQSGPSSSDRTAKYQTWPCIRGLHSPARIKGMLECFKLNWICIYNWSVQSPVQSQSVQSKSKCAKLNSNNSQALSAIRQHPSGLACSNSLSHIARYLLESPRSLAQFPEHQNLNHSESNSDSNSDPDSDSDPKKQQELPYTDTDTHSPTPYVPSSHPSRLRRYMSTHLCGYEFDPVCQVDVEQQVHPLRSNCCYLHGK